MTPSTPAPTLLVACLCAQWCGTCRDYRAVFDAAAASLGAAARCLWIDIEDDEAVVGTADVEDFPTLLIARGEVPVFFGPITPQPGTLARLLQSAVDDALGRLTAPETTALVGRAWSMGGA
jgi:thioredoxin 1